MGRLTGYAKEINKKRQQVNKVQEKIEKVKGLYQTAKNLYHEETRTAELITQGYSRLQGLANICPGATMYLKWHEEHINRLAQALKARKLSDMAVKSFNTAMSMSRDLVKQKSLLRSKYWYVFEMTDGDGRLSQRVDKIQEMRDYYTYAEYSKDYYELLRTKHTWPAEDRDYIQANVNIYPHELATRRQIAGDKIIEITGEVTGAYFAFCRDFRKLRENAKSCSTKLKKLVQGKASDWETLDKVVGKGTAKKLMEEALGGGDKKAFDAVHHFVWGNPLQSGAVSDAADAASQLGRLAQAWLRWSRLVETGDHTEAF